MRVRVRAPTGAWVINLPSDATWFDLVHKIAATTSVQHFDLKYGYPPRTLDRLDDDIPLVATGLSLDGEQLIVVPSGPPSDPTPPSVDRDPAPLSLDRKPAPSDSDLPLIPVPALDASLTLRVMPDDNSCLFRALSSAIFSSSIDGMTELRSAVAQRIQADATYSPAVLGKSRDAYCAWIQNPNSWGGGIELAILSQEFGVEVCSVNVQDGRVDVFNDGAARRVVLVYSGIHYDVVAVTDGDGPDGDRKVFDVADGEDGGVLNAAKELCAKLRERHYYTDTNGFAIKCNVCGWTGNGEKAATVHATQTGHGNFGEC